ncbi:MAG: hypothetical protein Q7T17_14920 [Microbacterium sp.]|uniref:hypothetical protein n=1 Tax=Microbacterium sp. TaxID=51671 RepID=UPI002720E53C|nr:hypothetical protein [Microbacterium sp.]MDO8384253.1 hypothetical protein [Microbacterium sp.]
MLPDPYVSLLRRGALALMVMSTVVMSAVALAGCTAAPQPTPTSTGDPTPEITTLGETPDASETPSPEPVADISIPASCEDIYSAEMLSLLQAGNPPLNDPGVTMESTEVPDAFEVLASGAQTLRCSWGLPSSYGLATNVTIVDPDQASTVRDALESAGFACGDLAEGTVCRTQQTEEENAFGESHYLQANGWVSTRWINFGPQGYTEDVVTTLWE